MSLKVASGSASKTAGAGDARDFELVSPPSDGISSVVFSSFSSLLLSSSWDGGIRLHDAQSNTLKHHVQSPSPVLDAALTPNDSTAFFGGLDNSLKTVDLESGTPRTLGSHSSGVSCVLYDVNTSLVISGSWDQHVSLWDPRSASSSGGASLPGKVYSMCLSNNRLVVATSARHIHIYDLRNMAEPEQRRESSLKHQTRAVAAFPDGSGYVLSSIEGRVAVEYFDTRPEIQAKKYAFKCHRSRAPAPDTRTVVYPVNAIAFHPLHGTFASGGDDGIVSIWDGANRKRIRQFPSYPTSVASLSFSSDGRMLAIASSYTYSEGERDYEGDSIYIRKVEPSDVTPRAKAAVARA